MDHELNCPGIKATERKWGSLANKNNTNLCPPVLHCLGCLTSSFSFTASTTESRKPNTCFPRFLCSQIALWQSSSQWDIHRSLLEDFWVFGQYRDSTVGSTVTEGSSHWQPPPPQQDIRSGAGGRTQFCCKTESRLKLPCKAPANFALDQDLWPFLIVLERKGESSSPY